MNTNIAVETNSVSNGRARFSGTLPLLAGVCVIGLILLYAGVRLLRCHRTHLPHADRYTVHRH